MVDLWACLEQYGGGLGAVMWVSMQLEYAVNQRVQQLSLLMQASTSNSRSWLYALLPLPTCMQACMRDLC